MLVSLCMVVRPLVAMCMGLLVTVVVVPLVAVVVRRHRLCVMLMLSLGVRLERRSGISPVEVIMLHLVVVLDLVFVVLHVDLNVGGRVLVMVLLLLLVVLVVVRRLTLHLNLDVDAVDVRVDGGVMMMRDIGVLLQCLSLLMVVVRAVLEHLKRH
jgi:hypothetical protein